MFTENTSINNPIYKESNQETIENIKEKINIIYQQIKKNELTPKTSYLFNNTICDKTKNLENTIQKLNTLDNITNFIPRKN